MPLSFSFLASARKVAVYLSDILSRHLLSSFFRGNFAISAVICEESEWMVPILSSVALRLSAAFGFHSRRELRWDDKLEKPVSLFPASGSFVIDAGIWYRLQ